MPPWGSTLFQRGSQEIAIQAADLQRTFAVRLTPLTSVTGHRWGHVAVFHEITRHQQTVTILRALAEHQATLLAQIAQSQYAAEAAQHDQADFITRIAHELTTPILTMQRETAALMMTPTAPLDPEMASYTTQIRTNLESLFLLITDLNDTTQIEGDAFALTATVVNLTDVTTQVIRSLNSILHAYHHTLIIDVSPTLPQLWGDPRRVAQIITNLISNACKYTPPGGQISLAAARDPVQTGFLRISIRDTGYGIPPEQQARIFTKFFRGATVKARNIPGTGLGLHITQQLVERHGGTIWFESVVGRGTTFLFTLPIATPSMSAS